MSSSRRSSRLKRQRDDDEEIMPRKIIKTTHEYTFNISPTVSEMFDLMEEGTNDEPEIITYNNDEGTELSYKLQGTERGGHFTYDKNDEDKTVNITGYELADFVPGTTSLNSGDFPFTFHTHPVVIKDDIEVDNYPNWKFLISFLVIWINFLNS